MAVPVKTHTDTAISAVSTTLQEYDSHVAALATGAFLIGFTEGSSPSDVLIATFDGHGSQFYPGTPYTTSDSQNSVSLFGLGTGAAAVTWVDSYTSNGTTTTYIEASIFDPKSFEFTSEFTVNVNDYTGSVYRPEVTELSGGDLAFVWVDSSTHVIKAATFSGYGVNIANNITVGTSTDALSSPDLGLTPLGGAAGGGSFVVSWTGSGADHLEIVSAVGVQSPQINLPGTGSTDVTVLADGRFVATYYVSGSHHAEIFNPDGTLSVGDFQLSTSNGYQAVAALLDGRFMVVYDTTGDIFGRIWNADGTPSSPEFQVNTNSTGTQDQPALETLADGRVVVTWDDSSTGGGDIYYTILDPREAGVQITGTPYDDSYVGSAYADNFSLGDGNDEVFAGAGNDTVLGGAGNDILNGGPGTNVLDGGTGTDAADYSTSVNGVTVNLAAGFANNGVDTADTLISIENVYGSSHDDIITGDAKNNFLWGSGGNDILNGGAGNDTLQEHAGHATMTGGPGSDTFVIYFDTWSQTITDFTPGVDKIELNTNFFGLFGTLPAAEFVAGPGPTSGITLFYYDISGNLYYDPDGSGTNRPPELVASLGSAFTSSNLGGNTDWNVAGAGDFNHDGTSDVIWRSASSGQDLLFLMSNGQQVGPAINLGGNTDWSPVATGDFNHDGTTDIIWRSASSGQDLLWLMNNGQQSGAPVNLGGNTDWSPVATGDFNHDGTTDIIWRSASSGQDLLWLMNNGQQMGAPINLGGNTDWTVAATGDFNGDGTTDIIWRSNGSGQDLLWLMNNGQQSGAAINLGGDLNWRPAATGDYNHDGTTDIVWRNSSSGQDLLWTMANGHSIYTQGVGGDANWAPVAAAGDYNGDGAADIIWHNNSSGQDLLWEMGGFHPLLTNADIFGAYPTVPNP